MAENCDESKEEKARRLAENGNKNREPKCSHYVWSLPNEYKREEQQPLQQRMHMAILIYLTLHMANRLKSTCHAY